VSDPHAQYSMSPVGPPQTTGGELYGALSPYASWGRRAAALIMDGILTLVIALAVTGLAHRKLPWDALSKVPKGSTKQPHLLVHELTFFVVAFVVAGLVYPIAFLASRWRATPGMRAMSIHAEGADGSTLSFGRAALRTLVLGAILFVALSIPLVGGLLILADFLWPTWDRPRRQTLHDKAGRTVVLNGPSGVAAAGVVAPGSLVPPPLAPPRTSPPPPPGAPPIVS